MKTLGALLLLLLGLAYGFEENEFIAKPKGNFLKNNLSIKPLVVGGTRKEIVASDDIENNEFFSTEKVIDEEIAIISKFLRAIKRTKDNELRNIFADDVEEDHFFLLKGKKPFFSGLPHHVSKYAFVDDSLKAAKQQALRSIQQKL